MVEESTKPLWSLGRRETILDALASAVRQWPNRTYLDICNDRAYSFAEIDLLSNRVAHGLIDLGIKPGDAICTMLDNNIDTIALFFGIMKAGALYVPLNTALKGDFLRHQIANCDAVAMVVEQDFAGRVVDIEAELPSLRTLVHRGTGPAGSGLATMSVDRLWSRNTDALTTTAAPGDLAMLIYTSGTTGSSKACMLSHNYLCLYTRDINYIGDIGHDDVLYVASPMFHVSCVGMVLTGLFGGSAIALDQRFSVSNFWKEIRRSGATHASLIGAMISLLATAKDNEDSKACHGQLRRLIGAPFTPEIRTLWRERFGVQYAHNTGYGMTEACFIFLTPPDADPPPGASGICAPHMDARIFDDDGAECPPDVAGELVIRPLRPNVMFEGYLNRPADTLKVFKDLWFHTGDIGRIDARGYFHFVDRKKDYLRRRGENISSFEVEAAFMRHPDVAEAAIHAVPSELTEDEVKLTAVLVPGATLDAETLCRWAADRLPYFAVPRFIEFRAALPYTPSGRVLKYVLRDEGVTAATWDREQAGLVLAKR